MAMIEKLRKFLGKEGYAGARLSNLPKSSTLAVIALTELTH